MHSLGVWQERGETDFCVSLSFFHVVSLFTQRKFEDANILEDSCVSGRKLVDNKGLYDNYLSVKGNETYGSVFKKARPSPAELKILPLT